MMGQSLLEYTAEVFAGSGGVGVVTAILFFACLGVGIERWLFWRRFRPRGSGSKRAASLATVEDLIRAGRFAEAGERADRSRDPILSILGRALSGLRTPGAWSSVRESVMEESVGGDITAGRRLLVTAIQVFGLLGMLGTCKGLYAQLSGFSGMADAGSARAAMDGMAEAFTTTLVGLTAAALMTPVYVLNEAAIGRFTRRLRRLDARVRAALTEYEACGGAVSVSDEGKGGDG